MTITIRLASWSEARDTARAIRYAVFVEEQGVPVELEWDEWDEPSWHALALAEDGSALATGRLLPDGHIGRMAVLKPARGSGVGAMVLDALMAKAAETSMRASAASMAIMLASVRSRAACAATSASMARRSSTICNTDSSVATSV